ncbi:MAG: hypothetical protein IIT88_05415, partial [Acetobacter sp.]|nr:hypothetical protein [Acetobacter sp.]
YAPALVPAEDAAREVSLDEANAYLDTAVHAGRGIALGVGCMILLTFLLCYLVLKYREINHYVCNA